MSTLTILLNRTDWSVSKAQSLKVGSRPGCPKPGIGLCVEKCGGHGMGCTNGKICCFNGCGHTCVNPGNNSIFLLLVFYF